jgi:hypothetical protein
MNYPSNLWSRSEQRPLIIKWPESRPTVNPVHIGEPVARSASVSSSVSHLNIVLRYNTITIPWSPRKHYIILVI